MTVTKADMTAQIAFEHLYDKNQLIPRLTKEFDDEPEFMLLAEQFDKPIKFIINLLVQMVLHKRANVSTMVGLLHRHFDSLQDCADALLWAAQVDLVDYDEFSKQLILVFDVSQDVYDDLELYQYPLPCLVEPKELTNNHDTGYHSFPVSGGSVILKGGNHHDDDVCLDHLNRMNRIPLSINADTARMIQNEWRNLDKPKEGEDQQSYDRRLKAFEKYDRSARDIMEHLFMYGNEFYLTHKYDKRGRTYSQGYHVNTQGNPWNKAVVEFSQKENASS